MSFVPRPNEGIPKSSRNYSLQGNPALGETFGARNLGISPAGPSLPKASRNEAVLSFSTSLF